jgi:uncharacterized protein YlxW (UPF0749 family)
LERKVQQLEEERSGYEAKIEAEREKYLKAKADLDEALKTLEEMCGV